MIICASCGSFRQFKEEACPGCVAARAQAEAVGAGPVPVAEVPSRSLLPTSAGRLRSASPAGGRMVRPVAKGPTTERVAAVAALIAEVTPGRKRKKPKQRSGPWDAEGISYRTWYRRRQRAGQSGARRRE